MAPPKSLWKRPKAHIYEDNFSFGNSYYAPVLDLVEQKDEKSGAQSEASSVVDESVASQKLSIRSRYARQKQVKVSEVIRKSNSAFHLHPDELPVVDIERTPSRSPPPPSQDGSTNTQPRREIRPGQPHRRWMCSMHELHKQWMEEHRERVKTEDEVYAEEESKRQQYLHRVQREEAASVRSQREGSADRLSCATEEFPDTVVGEDDVRYRRRLRSYHYPFRF